jgi:hypothetical protein
VTVANACSIRDGMQNPAGHIVSKDGNHGHDPLDNPAGREFAG